MSTQTYVGSELELFADAVNWKQYWLSKVTGFLGKRVLEVGAGLGGTTELAIAHTSDDLEQWLCLEPDPALATQIDQLIAQQRLPAACQTHVGTIEGLAESPDFDTILYIDVLEHIEHDADEVRRAVKRLVPGGHLIALSPALQTLYSPFDKAIGHFRRYTRSSLAAIAPDELAIRRLQYLDCLGASLSLGNRLVLSSSQPTTRQIRFWDRFVVPISRWLDPIQGHVLAGRSVLAVWQKGD